MYEMPALISGRITPLKQREIFAEMGTVQGTAPHEAGYAQIGSLAVRALSGSRANSFTLPIPQAQSTMPSSVPIQTQSSLGTASTQIISPASVSPVLPSAPRQRKPRTSAAIQAENAAESGGNATPPTLLAPPPLAVGPRWPDLVDGDDNSSQNSGWEIGGYG